MSHHLYSGHLFFASLVTLALVVAADLCGVFSRSTLLQSAARVVSLLAVAVAALGATPVSLWLTIPGVACLVVYLGARQEVVPGLRAFAGVATIVVAVVSVTFEARYHLSRTELRRPARIIVLGDSLSSGGFGESRPWPESLAAKVGSEVVNLARPGDTAAAAVRGQLPEVPGALPGDLVILELGGNDMLEGEEAATFEEAIDVLSGSLTSGGHRVAMFELPLLPGRWAYGAAQRRVAARHGIELVPKRVLAAVLLDPSSTYDGLHLTQEGHDELARAVEKWAGWR